MNDDGPASLGATAQELEALAQDPQFQELCSQFNILDAFGVGHQELRHSDILGYLLDPRQSHSLGQAFLANFVSAIRHELKEGGVVWDIGARKPDIRVAGHDVEVLRERGQIDLVVRKLGAWVLIIENKIRARESRHQLTKYKNHADKIWDKEERHFLYLTPRPESVQHGDAAVWRNVTYASVCVALAETQRQVQNHSTQHPVGPIDKEERMRLVSLLSDYQQRLRDEIMNTNTTEGACAELYAKYPRQIETLIANFPDLKAILRPHFWKAATKLVGKENVWMGNDGMPNFAPASTNEIAATFGGRPTQGRNEAERGFHASYGFDVSKRQVRLAVYLMKPGKTAVGDARTMVVDTPELNGRAGSKTGDYLHCHSTDLLARDRIPSLLLQDKNGSVVVDELVNLAKPVVNAIAPRVEEILQAVGPQKNQELL